MIMPSARFPRFWRVRALSTFQAVHTIPGRTAKSSKRSRKRRSNSCRCHPASARGHRAGTVVAGRDAARPEERPGTAMGAQGHTTAPTCRSALHLGLAVRRYLSGVGQSCRADHALVSISKHLESLELLVTPRLRQGFAGGTGCGRVRTAVVMTAANCAMCWPSRRRSWCSHGSASRPALPNT